MKRILSIIALGLPLAACSTVQSVTDRIGLGGGAAQGQVNAPADPFKPAGEAPELTAETAAPPPPSSAQTAEALDTTTPEQRAAASAPAAPSPALGTTVASLGSATEPGLWLKTPLVSEEQQGRVTNPATGKSSVVTLIPLPGPATAGSQMSLSAMRLIGASLTELTEVEVSLAS
ncbi:MAG: hypothetical protein P1U53_12885 [Sulfitobacter sp.]|nr:hypothetical protein [Sulfitobacter sp.]